MSNENYGKISISLFSDIVSEISPYCEFLMLYWMGEPLLHPELAEILEIARSQIRGNIVLSSNMTIYDERTYASICENVDVVLCCIDRWNSVAYERIRVGAKFDEVVKNTERLIELRKKRGEADIIVKALDLKIDSPEFKEFELYWKARGARAMLAWLNDWAGEMPGVRNAASIPLPTASDRRGACSDIWFKMPINWKGEVQMCCFDWNYRHAVDSSRARVDGVLGCWHSNFMSALRSKHIIGDWACNSLCKSCTTPGTREEFEAYVNFGEDSYFAIF